jgi:predicted PurR-regulated permease PerM
MEDAYFKKIMTIVIVAILSVLAFLLLKPILISIITGILLAYVFIPVYKIFHKYTKSKNFSAIIISVVLVILIVVPFWFLTPVVIDQSIKIYFASQQMDFVTPLKKIFPSFFASEQFSNEIGAVIHSFVTKTTNSLMNTFSELLLNLPVLSLHLMVVAFIFFFVLRDHEEIVEYIRSLLPFTKDVEKKLFDNTKGITNSVIYGQIVIGLIQGIITGLGFFIFGVSNALLLTLLATLAGILPIIGTGLVVVPVVAYLLIAGNTVPAIGVSIFGIISSTIDNVLRPIIVSKRTQIHSGVLLVGMISGIFLFGVLGLILGPLILSYLLVILEVYRNKKSPEFLIKKES